MTNPWRRGVTTSPKQNMITLAVLTIVDLFCGGQFIMNSMRGSLMIPTQVEYTNAPIFGSHHSYVPTQKVRVRVFSFPPEGK